MLLCLRYLEMTSSLHHTQTYNDIISRHGDVFHDIITCYDVIITPHIETTKITNLCKSKLFFDVVVSTVDNAQC